MEPEGKTLETTRNFIINADTLPERFTIVGAVKKAGGYVVIGKEENIRLKEGHNYCSWFYDPRGGFFYGHYGLTEEEAYAEFTNRG